MGDEIEKVAKEEVKTVLEIDRKPKKLLSMKTDGSVEVNCSNEAEFLELIEDLLTRLNNVVNINKVLQEQLQEASAEHEEGFKDDNDN